MGQTGDDKDLDRRHFLQCMAWVGTGAVWTLSSGILKGSPLGQSSRGSMMSHGAGVLHFVQISDTHIGFDKPANTDVTATLRAAIANIKADPEPPAFVLHTGDLTHCRRLLNSTRCSRSFPTCRCLCSMCPASTTYSRTTARATCSDSARGPAAPAGIASTTAASTSPAW